MKKTFNSIAENTVLFYWIEFNCLNCKVYL
jgi:hypothetical protein